MWKLKGLELFDRRRVFQELGLGGGRGVGCVFALGGGCSTGYRYTGFGLV